MATFSNPENRTSATFTASEDRPSTTLSNPESHPTTGGVTGTPLGLLLAITHNTGGSGTTWANPENK